MVGDQGCHYRCALVLVPQGGAVVEIKADQAVGGFDVHRFVEDFQQIVAVVAAMCCQSKGDAGGVEESAIGERRFPVHHPRAQSTGSRVHALVPAYVLARCTADFVDETPDRLGFRRPYHVVGVHPLSASGIAQQPTIWVVRYAGDVGRGDAEAGQHYGQRILAAGH